MSRGKLGGKPQKVAKSDFVAIIRQQDGIIKQMIAKIGELEHTINTVAGFIQEDIAILDARQKTFRGREYYFNYNASCTDEDYAHICEMANNELFLEARARKIREQDHEKALREIVGEYEEADESERADLPTQAEVLIYNEAKAELDIIDAAREAKELVVLRAHLEKQSEQIIDHIERSNPIPLQLSEAQRQTKARIVELQGYATERSDGSDQGEVLPSVDNEDRSADEGEVLLPSEGDGS